MNATELATLTIKELKSIAQDKGIEVTGDKRLKATYINAISQGLGSANETFQSEPAVIEIIETLPAIPDPFEDATEVYQQIDLMEAAKMAVSAPIAESIVQPTPLAIPPTPQYRGASIVMLAPLILLTVAVILIKIGIGVLIPLIGSLMRFMGSIWQSFTHTDRSTESIPIDSHEPHETLFRHSKWALLE
jgi:hypothetical protein